MKKPKIGFEYTRLTVPVKNILPIRMVHEPHKRVVRYQAILESIKEVGVIEPLMVYPEKGNTGKYMLLDGHLRLHALKELKIKTVECLVATDDESYTYNARISRLTPIQEHKMIAKAVKNGVTPERIAKALNMNVKDIRASLNLLKGVHAEAADILKDKQIAPGTLKIFKKVTAIRQIEMAEMMANSNNYTKGYAEALLMGTPRDQLSKPENPKKVPGLSPEEIARMEQEMEKLERDFKEIEGTYGENMLKLTLARGYVKKLLDNPKVKKFLQANYDQFFNEFEGVAAAEGL